MTDVQLSLAVLLYIALVLVCLGGVLVYFICGPRKMPELHESTTWPDDTSLRKP